MLPTRTTRKKFIEQYLESYNSYKPAGSRGNFSVDQLCRDVDGYRGMPGFYWALFSFIQIEISDVDFDFLGFAESKLGEYCAWRREVEGTREQAGEEIPFRERRWALV
jgi:ethanolamine kinase